MPYTIKYNGQEKEFTNKQEFKDTCDLLDERNVDYKTETPETHTDGGPKEAEPVTAETVTTESSGQELISHPISYLRGINDDFVNVISGTPAISKRGFRYMQTELGISTTSEVVATFDDPKGVVVHARAEMPDGRCAEAHGEGYLTESGVDDNEFVRFADTRAKSRAISDLTAAGALSEAEL